MNAITRAITTAIAAPLASFSARLADGSWLRTRPSGRALLGACTCALGGRLLRDIGVPDTRGSLHDTLSAIRIEHTI